MKSVHVTAHAVLRYLTRVEGFDLRPVVKQLGRDAGNWATACAAARAFGAPIEQLQRRICPPDIHPAILAGATAIKRDGFMLLCQNGVVASVVEKDKRRATTRIRSKRETRKTMQRMARRGRWK